MTASSHRGGSVPLTLADVTARPERMTWTVQLAGGLSGSLRPIDSGDRAALHRFHEELGPETKHHYDLPPDLGALAEAHCREIGRFDKLRLILELPDGIAGIFELSLDLVDNDVERYRNRGMTLQAGRDIRYGLCVRDDLQGRGVAAAVQPVVNRAALLLGAHRLILWGGVLESNSRAIAFYERCGFVAAGSFMAADGQPCLDMWLSLPEASRS